MHCASFCSAKTIKNVVVVNEELTAEEWKRRYEREREKVLRLRAQLAAAEAELTRWHKGEKVPESEWANLQDPTLQVHLYLPIIYLCTVIKLLIVLRHHRRLRRAAPTCAPTAVAHPARPNR